jgi:hypothetical protein
MATVVSTSPGGITRAVTEALPLNSRPVTTVMSERVISHEALSLPSDLAHTSNGPTIVSPSFDTEEPIASFRSEISWNNVHEVRRSHDDNG